MVESTANKVRAAKEHLTASSESLARVPQKQEAAVAAIGSSILLLDELRGLLLFVREKRETNKTAAGRVAEHVKQAFQLLQEAQIESTGANANSLIANTSAAHGASQTVRVLSGYPGEKQVSELYTPDGFEEFADTLREVQSVMKSSLDQFPAAKGYVDTAIEASTFWLDGLDKST